MNDQSPRRRLRDRAPDEPRGALPLFPLLIVVVFVGLGIGALLSRHFQAGSGDRVSTTQTVTGDRSTSAPVVSAHASPSAGRVTTPPTATPAPKATPHRLALVTPKPKPVARKTPPPAVPTAAPPASPLPTPTTRSVLPARTAPAPRTPAPRTPAPRTPAPRTPSPRTPSPRPVPVRTTKPSSSRVAVPSTGAAAAAEVARTYLAALIRGDVGTANTALGRGPENTDFSERAILDARSRITDLHTTSNGDGTYKVEAEIAGSKGTFFVTMQVARNEANAYYISDHYAVRIQ